MVKLGAVVISLLIGAGGFASGGNIPPTQQTYASGSYTAEEYDIKSVVDEQLESSGAQEIYDALPQDTADYMERLDVDISGAGEESSFQNVVDTLAQMTADELQTPLVACLSAVGMVLLCAVVQALADNKNASASKAMETVSTAAVIAAIAVPAVGYIDDAAKSICAACDFFSIFTPIFSSFVLASGQTATAAGYSAFMLTLTEIMTLLISSVIMPLLRVFAAIATASSIAPSLKLEEPIGMIEKNSKWVLGLLAALLAGGLGISSVAASASDSATAKAVKFVISGTVPVVGGAIADAAATVKNCVGIARASVGGFGMIAGAFIFLPIIIRSAAWIFSLGLASSACGMIGAESPASLMKNLSSAVTLVLSVTVFTAVVLISSVGIILNMRTA